jgi:hypothetical protein
MSLSNFKLFPSLEERVGSFSPFSISNMRNSKEFPIKIKLKGGI